MGHSYLLDGPDLCSAITEHAYVLAANLPLIAFPRLGANALQQAQQRPRRAMTSGAGPSPACVALLDLR